MNRKKTIGLFIIGLLSGLFIILPILYSLGLPSYDVFLTKVFGEDNPLALVVTILLLCLVIIGIYKIPKNID